MSKKVLVRLPFTQMQRQQLCELADHYGDEMIFSETDAPTAQEMQGVQAVIGNIDVKSLPHGASLEWVQLNSSGADAYAKDGVIRPDAALTSATGAYGTAIAEYMVCYLLMMMKKVPTYLQNAQRKIWQKEGMVVSPAGKRILIVGTGNIGLEFAKRIRAFDIASTNAEINTISGAAGESDLDQTGQRMIISGIRRRPGVCPSELDEIHGMEELEQEVAKADVIALCLPGTPQTAHLFDKDMLLACKEGSYLMNVGRGSVIDNSALLQKDVYEHFAGMWLDVFEQEPLPEGNSLFDVPNLLITPHITGGYHLDITLQNIFEIAMHNYRAWHGDEGVDFISVVDRSTGYCK